MTVPEEFGGTGCGAVAYVGAMIEFSKVDSGMSVAVSVQNSLVNDAIMLFGTEEQKKTFLPKLTSGEWIGCMGLTEPGAGSDAGSIQTTAVKKGDRWVLNGSKTFITNAPVCDVCVVYATVDKVKYTTIYSGTSSYCKASSSLWTWFLASGTTVYWYVEGVSATGATVCKSSMGYFMKR